MTLAAIVLAAGQLADRSVAAQLRLGDETLGEHVVRQVREAGVRDIEVVLGPNADVIIPTLALEDVEPIVDARWSDGVASWLRTGASAVPRGTNLALIIDVREPRPAWLLQGVIEASTHDAIAHAEYDGAVGSPWVVPEDALARLRTMRGELGDDLAALMARCGALKPTALDTPLATLRIETLDDVRSYEQSLSAHPGQG